MRTLKTYGSNALQYNKENLPQILRWVTPNGRVLEFGPAMGYMTRYMKETLHCNVTAVELSEEMAQYAKQHAEKVVIANLDSDAWENEIEGTFDYILFADVLEHLREPEKVLQLATSFLRPNGSILTSIPNIGHSAIIMSLLDGEFNYTNYGLLDSTHIHFFTRKSIVNMMTNCGLGCVAEQNTTQSPGSPEHKRFFIKHLLLIPAIINKRDILVYQFVNQWKLKANTTDLKIYKGTRLSLFRKLFMLLDDLNEYISDKYNYKFALPKRIKMIVRKK